MQETSEPSRHSVTFLPSSTYIFQDERQPQSGRVVFSTSASGNPEAVSPDSRPSSVGSGSSGGGKTAPSGPTGSCRLGDRSIPRDTEWKRQHAGKLTLIRNGKTVSSLKSGRYKIVVLDETSKSGFMLQKLGKQASKLTGAPFVGRRTVTLTLKAGQWMFYSSTAKKNYFVVIA